MINSNSIDDLHPVVKKGAKELIKRAKKQHINIKITSTYRDFQYQNILYSIGRSTKGSIITNAKGGQSFHNYKLAFDICNNVKGDAYNLSVLNKVGKIGTDMGFLWGGTFTTLKDTPHYQFSNGLSIKDLQNGKTLDENIKMKWEEIYTIEDALQVFIKHKIITNDNYWKKALSVTNYLDVLFIKAAPNIDYTKNNNIYYYEDAINYLVKENIINSPTYWLEACHTIKYLKILITRISNKI